MSRVILISEQEELARQHATPERPFTGLLTTKDDDWTWYFVESFRTRSEADYWWDCQEKPARVYYCVSGNKVHLCDAK